MTATFARGERPRPEWLREHPKAWLAAVATVCFGAFMGQLDASVVALTYRSIGDTFHAGLDTVQWVTLTYLIALAGLLVPLGAASDRLGRKRVYLWGFAVFGMASLGCALAPNLVVLDATRAVQGAGAAMLQANSVALVATSVTRVRLRTALGIQAAAQALGLALGPTLGGLIVQTIGWRWVFGINVPIAIAAIVLGRFLLPRTRVTAHATRGRLRSVLATPAMPRRLAGALLAYLLLFGPIVLVPNLLLAHGESALLAGLVVAALPVGFALSAALGDRLLPHRWSTGTRCGTGLAVTAAALVGLAAAGTDPAGCAAAMFAIGIGIGCYTPANNALIMGSIGPHVAALAGGLVNTARALGTAGGTAVVAESLSTSGGGSHVTLAVLLVVAVVAATTVERRRPDQYEPDSQPVQR
ncbi:MAG: MFS transporter [Jatrophihabitantaceae bacterium]